MNHFLGKLFHKKMVEPSRNWLYRTTRKILLAVFLVMLINFIFSYGFTTPKMWRLGRINNDLISEYETLNSKIEKLTAELQDIENHDKKLYHAIFSIDTLNNPLFWTIYDDSHYDSIAYGRYADIMISTEKNFDALAHRLYGESLSMDDVEKIAVSKDIMMEHIPTMWPVDRSKIKNIGAFGYRIHPIFRYRRMHTGIDLSGQTGTPVYATGDGLVESEGFYGGYGRQVLINHQFGYKTRYAHLRKILVAKGQWVHRGEIIGTMGSSGRSTGTHLHYEVILRGKPVNPMSYLRNDMNEEEFRKIIESVGTTTFEVD